MADRTLHVWLDGQLAGHLDQESGRIVFTYDPGWVARAVAPPLSLSLPVRSEPYDDRAARPFFAGLLPEQEKRDQVARALHISARNDFALLDALGGECAGAVSLTRTTTRPPEPSASDYRTVSDQDLATILDRLPERPLLAGEQGVRLSLAGAQDKLPVRVIEGQIALPLNGSPSSHILKPSIRRIEDSVQNEGFCLELARTIGLETVHSEIRATPMLFLLVTRYDRVAEPGRDLHRLHQEDFGQALGVAPEYKYQNEGGPSLVDCVELIRKATRPAARYIPQFVNAVIFNALIGNHDAHAKNYSLIYRESGCALAPLYDLVSTAAYPQLSPKMAMKIGGYYGFADVMPRHWERFAKDAGLPAPQVRRRVLALAERLPGAAQALSGTFREGGLSTPVIGRILAIIEERCSLTRRRFAASATP